MITEPNVGFKHWSESDEDDAPPFDFGTPIDKDTHLYLITKAAHKVTFDTKGGNEILPVYVDHNTPVARPANPVRAGYTFVRWEDASAQGTDYEFSAPVTSALELQVSWTPATNTPFTVIYQIENADDDGYSFEASRVYTGTTGAVINLNNYPGALSINNVNPDYRRFFRYENGWTQDPNQTIAEDGSSSVIVKFRRNTYNTRLVFSARGASDYVIVDGSRTIY